MRVIGTAGHVDHGKSTLIEALTGTHPDRLKEEREREMTIDLGFAWLTLPGSQGRSSEEVGIVDVPGHRDFIENMLAGIGGIDAALFVVAADEGVMPQTREHLAILDILQIQGGIVVLTKIDMIDDPDWLDLVEADVLQSLQGSVLGDAPVVRVSGRTGAGIPQLKETLRGLLAVHPSRPDLGRPRLPVDRVFTIAGFGSVVTGTLSDGCLRVGDEVEVLPQGLRGRIRGLQTHKHKEQTAVPGSRTAVNISGIALDQLQRGDVVAHPGTYHATQRLDLRFRLLPDVEQPLKHNTEVKLFVGTAEVLARLRLLGVEELEPGQAGWLQLELNSPVVAMRGDRYILRRPSPGETLGGGAVVDPHPKGRHKRFSEATLAALEALERGTPAEILAQAMTALGAAVLREVVARSNLEAAAAAEAVQELAAAQQLIDLEDKAPGLLQNLSAGAVLFAPEDLVIGAALWEQITRRALAETDAYHRNFPLRRGLPREELKSRLKPQIAQLSQMAQIWPRLFNLILRRLVVQNELAESGPLVFRPAHQISFNPQQQQSVERLMARFAANPNSPPTLKECQAEAGEDVITALIETGRLVLVAPEVVFRKEDFERMVADVRRLIQANGALTVAQARDHFNTSRRYVLALLEYLDATGVTVRDGDDRRLKVL